MDGKIKKQLIIIPQGSILWPVLVSIFINYLDAGVKCTLSQFDDDSELGGAADFLDDREELVERRVLDPKSGQSLEQSTQGSGQRSDRVQAASG